MSTNLSNKLITIALVMELSVCPTLAQGSAFTYQGRLDDAGVPADGLHDLRFRLFDAPVTGVQVGQTLCADNVVITDGLFGFPLDFGPQYATLAQRHLEIEVRRHTGLDCSNVGGFIVLAPRQLLTAVPLASHANAAYALDAADGSPENAVFVSHTGNVGVGTVAPQGRLDIRSGDASFVLVDVVNGDLHANGGTDRVFGLWNDSPGSARTDFVLGGAARLVITSGGTVGIGTTAPTAMLDVRGDIRLGPAGQFRAASGDESLRIVRGVISEGGAIITGSGFSVSHPSEGNYVITFNNSFSAPPAVTATAELGSFTAFAMTDGVTAAAATIAVINKQQADLYVDETFHFIAIGPR